MNIRKIIPFFVSCSMVLSACQSKVAEQTSKQVLFQVSTIDALLQGDYDGSIALSELVSKGDLGIGTTHALDGELMLENGQFFQIKSDGNVYRPDLRMKTPFASVVKFAPEDSISVQNLDFTALKTLIDSLLKSRNYFYAIRLEGEFSLVRTRSVPVQQKPYPILAEITRHQPEFEIEETSGVLIGFFCPEFVKGINMPGYHLHFLSNDHTTGGHLLDFKLKAGILKIDLIRKFEMILPDSQGFQKSEFRTDRSKELKEVEGSAIKMQ